MLCVAPSNSSNFLSSGPSILSRVLHTSHIIWVVLCYKTLFASAHPECVENYISDILRKVPLHASTLISHNNIETNYYHIFKNEFFCFIIYQFMFCDFISLRTSYMGIITSLSISPPPLRKHFPCACASSQIHALFSINVVTYVYTNIYAHIYMQSTKPVYHRSYFHMVWACCLGLDTLGRGSSLEETNSSSLVDSLTSCSSFVGMEISHVHFCCLIEVVFYDHISASILFFHTNTFLVFFSCRETSVCPKPLVLLTRSNLA